MPDVATGVPAAPRSLQVLVVDDDPVVASIHAGFVQAVPGCRVVGVAGTAAEALAAVARLAPDVLLLDLYLPDASGLDVLRRVRADGADVDVVVITAAREAATVREAAHGGVSGYLIKPFEARQLAEQLEHVRRTRDLTPPVLQQADVDRVLRTDQRTRGPAPDSAADPLPKGLSRETLQLVEGALLGATDPLSATEVATGLGLSRVAVRRYLEHFVRLGVAEVSLRYGAGRPERLYRRRA